MDSFTKVEGGIHLKEKERVEPNKSKGHTYVQWIYAVLAGTTLWTYGLQAGWLSPMTKVLQSEQSPIGVPLTDSEMSWVGSVLAMTATFGVGLYAYIADRYGRKFGVIAIAIPQTICWAIKLFATNTTMLIIARVIGGIPSGGCFNLIPMYVKEISQDNIRGTAVSFTLLMQNFGILFIYAVGSYLEYHTVLYIVLLGGVVTSVLMFFAPESPAYLVKMEKYEEAAQVTAHLRGLQIDDKIVQTEVQNMKNEELHFRSLPKISFLNIFQNKAWRRGFTFIMLLILGQAFNGAFTILTFAWSIMAASGVAASPELQSLIVPVLMICGSLASMLFVEKIGRKIPLASTFALTAVAFIVLACTQLLQSKGANPPTWIPVVAIAAAVWAYSTGVSPMVYVIMSEIFNFQVRAKLIGCIVTFAWFVSSGQISIFAPVSNVLGIYTMFFIFAGVNIFGTVVAVFIPETKGKNVAEIEQMLLGKT